MILGTGVDLVDVVRFERFLAQGNERIFIKLFTEQERDYCAAKKASARHFAGRFAAKEAFVKALGSGFQGIALHDVEVVNDPKGRPCLRLSGVARRLADEQGVTATHLSLAHDGGYAVAMVVLEGQ
jgi:holo-[acyl-carrier protein] synthase